MPAISARDWVRYAQALRRNHLDAWPNWVLRNSARLGHSSVVRIVWREGPAGAGGSWTRSGKSANVPAEPARAILPHPFPAEANPALRGLHTARPTEARSCQVGPRRSFDGSFFVPRVRRIRSKQASRRFDPGVRINAFRSRLQ